MDRKTKSKNANISGGSSVEPSSTVYLASFAALLGAVSMGMALGYTAPAFLTMGQSKIFSNDDSAEEKEKSLIGSMLTLGALVGGILGEPCNKFLGRRWSLIAYGIPFTIGWLAIALAKNVTTIIIGRLITGLCCGLVSGTAPTYVVEIAPPQIRGLLGTCFQVMVVIGILISAVLGMFIRWDALAGASIAAAVAMSILMFFMPETPQWLLSQNRSEEAEYSIKVLRTSSINNEFSVMTQAAQQAQRSGGSQYSMQTLKSREFYKPMLLAFGLMFFQQFSNVNGVLFYQGDIFKRASPTMNPIHATIYVCIAQVIATVLGSLLVDKLGRKALLQTSGIGHFLSLLVFGIHFNQSKTFQVENAWIPLACLIAFISSFSIGYGPIPWMMIPEFSSSKVRSMVASMATAFNWTCAYIVTANVKSLTSLVGDSWTYWIFSVICAISCIFVFFALPETKGKTSEQIQHELLGPRSDSRNEEAMTSPTV